VLVAVASACSGGGSPGAASAPERARVEKVRRADVTDRVLVTGTLDAKAAVELQVPRTNVWELTIKWMAEDGASVKAGDKVLEFDTSTFANQLAQGRLQYLEALLTFRSFVDVSVLEIAQKEFELETTRIALAKAKVLASVPADLLPARTAQERQLELKRAEGALAKTEKDLAAARAAASLDKQVKQIELDKVKAGIEDAEKAIGALVVSSPRDGVIVVGEHWWMGGRKFQIGDATQPGMTVMSLPDFTAGMEVRAELPDVDDGRVSVGMTGRCTLDAYPHEPMPCTVQSLMPVAGARGGQSLRRGFALVLSLGQVDQTRMLPGMSVKVELSRAPVVKALVVPRGAVSFGDKPRVKLPGGQRRDVELGACDAQVCIVNRGLAEADGVVIGGEP
jgi:multidrug efflux pump subunit AcrA (membrane-fusion protein)